MNLTEDSLKEICNRMDVDSLYNFIQTSEQNYKLCTNIYNLKYYEEVEYPELLKLFKAKQLILRKIKNLEKVNKVSYGNPSYMGIIVLSDVKVQSDEPIGLFWESFTKPARYGLHFTRKGINSTSIKRLGLTNIPGYPRLFVTDQQFDDIEAENLLYPDMYNQLIFIMATKNPKIKLEKLRKLV
jgi:hypothetical protein